MSSALAGRRRTSPHWRRSPWPRTRGRRPWNKTIDYAMTFLIKVKSPRLTWNMNMTLSSSSMNLSDWMWLFHSPVCQMELISSVCCRVGVPFTWLVETLTCCRLVVKIIVYTDNTVITGVRGLYRNKTTQSFLKFLHLWTEAGKAMLKQWKSACYKQQ